MKVIVNGKTENRSYQEICHTLGFIPEVQFVKVTNTGRISFTLGKPQEVRALIQSVRAKGFEPSRNLIRALGYC